MRAGVLPRLKRDKRQLDVLPPFRPQVHPLDELAQSVGIALGPGADWRHWRDAFAAEDLVRALSGLAGDLRAAHGQNEAQILITIDQAEEMFGAADKAEAATFVRVLNAMQDPSLPFLVVGGDAFRLSGRTAAGARPDRGVRGVLSQADASGDHVRDIIEGPARVAGLTVDEALVAPQ